MNGYHFNGITGAGKGTTSKKNHWETTYGIRTYFYWEYVPVPQMKNETALDIVSRNSLSIKVNLISVDASNQ